MGIDLIRSRWWLKYADLRYRWRWLILIISSKMVIIEVKKYSSNKAKWLLSNGSWWLSK
jgi:hypothetical protein